MKGILFVRDKSCWNWRFVQRFWCWEWNIDEMDTSKNKHIFSCPAIII